MLRFCKGTICTDVAGNSSPISGQEIPCVSHPTSDGQQATIYSSNVSGCPRALVEARLACVESGRADCDTILHAHVLHAQVCPVDAFLSATNASLLRDGKIAEPATCPVEQSTCGGDSNGPIGICIEGRCIAHDELPSDARDRNVLKRSGAACDTFLTRSDGRRICARTHTLHTPIDSHVVVTDGCPASSGETRDFVCQPGTSVVDEEASVVVASIAECTMLARERPEFTYEPSTGRCQYTVSRANDSLGAQTEVVLCRNPHR